MAHGQPGNSATPPTPTMQNSGLHSSIGAQGPEQTTSIPAEYTEPSMQYAATNIYPEVHLPDAGGQLSYITPPVHMPSFYASSEVSHSVDVRFFGHASPPEMSMAILPGPVIRQSGMRYGSHGMLARANNRSGYNASPEREDTRCFPYDGTFPQAITDVPQLPLQMHPLPVAAHTAYTGHAYSLTHFLPFNVNNLLEFGGAPQEPSSHSQSASSRQICPSGATLEFTPQANEAFSLLGQVHSATAMLPLEDAILDCVNPGVPPSSNIYKEAVDSALRCKCKKCEAQSVRPAKRQEDARSRADYINNGLQPWPRRPKFNDWLVSRPDRPNSEPEPLDWPPVKDIMQFTTESIRRSAAQLESTSYNSIQNQQTSGVKDFARSSASLEHTALVVESLEEGHKTNASQHPYRKPKTTTSSTRSIKDSILMPPPRTLPRRSTRVAHEAKLGQQPYTISQRPMHATSVMYHNPGASDHKALIEASRSDRDILDYPIPELPELHRNECPSKIDYGHLTAYGSAEAIASYPPTFQASLQRTMRHVAMYESRCRESHALVFVYGSLMISCLNHNIFNGRVSPFTISKVSQCMFTASVTAFKRYRVRGSHEPVALGTGKEKDVIHGMLIFNLSKDDCRNLDRYTGWGYVRSPARFRLKLKIGHTTGLAQIYCAPNDKFLDCSSRGEIMVDEPWTVEDFWENSPSCMEWRRQSGPNHRVKNWVQLQQNVQELSYPSHIDQDQPSARLDQGGMEQSLVYPDQPVTSQMLNSLEPPVLGWGDFPQIGPTQIMSNVEQVGLIQDWEGFGQDENNQTMINVEQVGLIRNWERSGQNDNEQTTSNIEQVDSAQDWERSGQNDNEQTTSNVEQVDSAQGWERAGQIDNEQTTSNVEQVDSAQDWERSGQNDHQQTTSNVEQVDSTQGWERVGQNDNEQTMSSVEQVDSAQDWKRFGQNGNDQTTSSVEQVGLLRNWEGIDQNSNDQTLNSFVNAAWEPFPNMDLDPNSLDAYDFGMSAAH